MKTRKTAKPAKPVKTKAAKRQAEILAARTAQPTPASGPAPAGPGKYESRPKTVGKRFWRQ